MDNEKLINQLIDIAIKEDIGTGDHTSLACLDVDIMGAAILLVKDKGILAGMRIAELVFRKIDPSIEMKYYMHDGDPIKNGDIAFKVEGPQISLLSAERLVLNFMQRMSGIATQTYKYTQALDGLKTKVLDTRKTAPGLRFIEKMAVKIGCGVNHRIGLFDMILIKDNHIDFAGNIENAVNHVKRYLKENELNLEIEVEARSLEDVEKILKMDGIKRILLDNFSIEETKKAVEIVNNKIETESSGAITLKNIRDYALCGVDFISIGALTHQIKSLDLSLKAI